MKQITEINSEEELSNHLDSSQGKNELIIFKYSPRCTISFVADKVITLWIKKIHENIPLKILKVNVITARTLSNFISDKFGIKHESPQLIWLDKNGEIKWQGSHHQITQEILESNLSG